MPDIAGRRPHGAIGRGVSKRHAFGLPLSRPNFQRCRDAEKRRPGS